MRWIGKRYEQNVQFKNKSSWCETMYSYSKWSYREKLQAANCTIRKPGPLVATAFTSVFF